MANEKLVWYSTTESNQWEEMSLTASTSTINSPHTLELTQVKRQTVDGFGGCFNELGWIALSKLSEEKKKEVLDELFLKLIMTMI